jgi:hypothetical protein
MGTTVIHPEYDLDAFGGGIRVQIGDAVRLFPRAIVAQICANADEQGRPRTLDLAVCIHESGGYLNPFVERHADNAGVPGAGPEDSYGILQINTRVPGRLPGEMYLGLDGLKRAQQLMNPRWQQAFLDLGGWPVYVRDCYGFLARFAPAAQGSVGWTLELARDAHAWAWVLADIYRDEELRAGAEREDPRVPHLVGALSVSRNEVSAAATQIEAALSRLNALVRGIDTALG